MTIYSSKPTATAPLDPQEVTSYGTMNLDPRNFLNCYLRLLKQLTEVGNVSESAFEKRFREFASRPSTYFIIVLEDVTSRKVVGCATLVVELKLIHECSKRGHIEDVVVDEACRKQGLGKLLIGTLIKVGEAEGCYKISLDCSKDKVEFYERNGFKQETISMCIRLSH
nr:expressed protein [Hymenolepis microstoma]